MFWKTMPMIPFDSLVGERAFKEMRAVSVMAEDRIPRGTYGFLELYCGEKDCDCRRVLFQVRREDVPDKVWATINFGWESAKFYQKWVGDPEMAEGMASATLEPFGEQSEYAKDFLDLFVQYLLPDETYVARLKRHYGEAKRLIRRNPMESNASGNRAEKRLTKKGRERKRRR